MMLRLPYLVELQHTCRMLHVGAIFCLQQVHLKIGVESILWHILCIEVAEPNNLLNSFMTFGLAKALIARNLLGTGRLVPPLACAHNI